MGWLLVKHFVIISDEYANDFAVIELVIGW